MGSGSDRLRLRLVTLASVALAAGCSTGSSHVSVRVDPPTAQVPTLTSEQFTASVGGTLDQTVLWSIGGGRTDAGSIDASGVYTAPAVVPKNDSIDIVAASAVDHSVLASAQISVVPVPILPARGPTAGGTKVTINGDGFDASTTVLFAGVAGTDVVVDSPVRLRVTTPPHALIEAADVTITSSKGTVVYPKAFHYAATQLRFGGSALGSVCGQIYDVATLDLDGDGRTDVAFACTYDSKIALLLQDGQGGFKHPVTIPSGGLYTERLLTGDVDGDGKPDLIAFDDYGWQVFRNQGDGTIAAYGPSHYYPDNSYYYYFQPAVADLDGDGKADVVFLSPYGDYATYTAQALLVQRNAGGGNFAAPQTLVAPPNLYPYRVMAGNIAGVAGKADVVVEYEETSPTVTTGGFAYYHNTTAAAGTITFASPISYAMQPNVVSDLTLADVNGDGKPDVVTTSYNDGVYVRLDTGTATNPYPSAPTVLTTSTTPYASTSHVADVDKDGKLDFLYYGYSSGPGLFVAYGTAAATFAFPGTFVPFASDPSEFAPIDLDGAGDLDLVGAGGSGLVETVLAGGTRLYGTTPTTVGDLPDFLQERARGTSREVLVATRDGGACTPTACGGVRVLDEGTLGVGKTYALPPGGEADRVLPATLNADADSDALVVDFGGLNGGTGRVWVLDGDGLGGFVVGTGLTASQAQVNDAATADLDGDGNADLLIASQLNASATSGTLEVRWGLGGGKFGPPQLVPSAVQPKSVMLADVDGDGAPEIVVTVTVANQVDVVKVGAGRTFALPVSLSVGLSPSQVIVADVNGDWIPDLIVLAQFLVNGNTLSEVDVLPGLGGNLEFDIAQHYVFAGTPVRMQYGDVDGDGMPDLIVTTQYPYAVAVLRGYDGGRFTDPELVPAGSNPYGVSLAQLDQDPLLDLVVTDLYAQSVLAMKNSSR